MLYIVFLLEGLFTPMYSNTLSPVTPPFPHWPQQEGFFYRLEIWSGWGNCQSYFNFTSSRLTVPSQSKTYSTITIQALFKFCKSLLKGRHTREQEVQQGEAILLQFSCLAESLPIVYEPHIVCSTPLREPAMEWWHMAKVQHCFNICTHY